MTPIEAKIVARLRLRRKGVDVEARGLDRFHEREQGKH